MGDSWDLKFISKDIESISENIKDELSDIKQANLKIVKLLEFIVKEIKEENGKDL